MFYIETNRTLENKFPHLNCGRCANYNTSPQNFIQQISTMCVYIVGFGWGTVMLKK
jgi:hypothetical protein